LRRVWHAKCVVKECKSRTIVLPAHGFLTVACQGEMM
jgi:hypothetical protein